MQSIEQPGSLKQLLIDCQTIAIVGMSRSPTRASFAVGRYLLDVGYTVIPVNPLYDDVLGLRCYPSLTDIPCSVDMVDCFRRSAQMPQLAKDAIAIKARVLWMQLGVMSAEAHTLAADAGLSVVVNRCTKIEHERLLK